MAWARKHVFAPSDLIQFPPSCARCGIPWHVILAAGNGDPSATCCLPGRRST